MSPVLRDYLQAFDDVGHRLPRDARQDLRARIWTHCAEVVRRDGSDGAMPDDRSGDDRIGDDRICDDRICDGQIRDDRIRDALAELGSPHDLVSGELERTGRRPRPFRPADTAPIHFLGASVLLLGIGAVIGLVLLWRSTVWRLQDKVLATLLVLAGPLVLVPVLPVLPALLLGVAALGPAAAGLQLLIVAHLRRRAA